MTQPSTETCYELIQRLGGAYSEVNSHSELFQATLDISAEMVDADVSVIAEKDDAGLQELASVPPEWTDTDGLLSPASLPSVIATQGISYLVTDRGDVRGAAATESLSKTSTIAYRSVLVVPFGDETVLLAASTDEEAFTESDLETLRVIASFASSLREHITDAGEPQQNQARTTEAMAGLSHDANNFLTIIEGRLQIARENPQAEHFEAIERATQRLKELIEDTRTLLETGTHAADPEPVALAEVAKEAWETDRPEEAELVTPPLESILADRSRLCQLFENLFRNAIDHAGPDVTVWVGMLPDDEGFYVEDDGPGIDPGKRDSVFEFGYTDADEHVGLGLNIVQWIAEAHGWDVSLSNGNMGGARFEFRNVELVD